MSRCLVLGGNGFLGSHLVDSLVAKGHEVWVFDRHSSEIPTYLSRGARAVRGDFMRSRDIRRSVEGMDFVFHFLSVTTPATAERDPILDVRGNIMQSVELLEACADAQVKRIFFASTGGALYGDQGLDRYAESDCPSPRSPYGISKLTIEQYMNYYRTAYDMDSTIMRISNPYGTRQRLGREQGLIPIVLHRVLTGKPVQVYGDGSMVRDYIYVNDLIAMVLQLVDGTPRHPVYNLGSGMGSSVQQVLDVIREVTQRQVTVNYVSKPRSFVDKVILDTSRYSSEFTPHPMVSLQEGVEITWKNMQ